MTYDNWKCQSPEDEEDERRRACRSEEDHDDQADRLYQAYKEGDLDRIDRVRR